MNNSLTYGHIGNYDYAMWDRNNLFYIRYTRDKVSSVQSYFQIWIRL